MELIIKNKETTWENFEGIIKNNTNHLYRGHSNYTWNLNSTLGRFIKKDRIQAAAYHNVLLSIISDEKINTDPNLNVPYLSNTSPFLNSLMVADNEHEQKFISTFSFMIKLRHVGFPSPIIDLTRDPYVAAFFALSDTKFDTDIAIYSIEKVHNNFDISENSIHISDFNFQEEGSRHESQSSSYMLAINQKQTEMYTHREQREGPYFLLSDIESSRKLKINKFIIINSGRDRLKLLQYLYEKGYSYEKIYGTTHQLENTYLKDLAIKKLLFSTEMNTLYYPWTDYRSKNHH